jgi:hypothetical protein
LARLGGTRDQTRATDETSNEPVNRWVKNQLRKKKPMGFFTKKKKGARPATES